MAYSAFIFSSQKEFSNIDDLMTLLSDFHPKRKSNDSLTISIGKYRFTITTNSDKVMLPEVKQFIANGAIRKDTIDTFRFELSGEDDSNMDYFNDFIFIASRISSHPAFEIYDIASQKVM